MASSVARVDFNVDGRKIKASKSKVNKVVEDVDVRDTCSDDARRYIEEMFCRQKTKAGELFVNDDVAMDGKAKVEVEVDQLPDTCEADAEAYVENLLGNLQAALPPLATEKQ